MSKFIAVTYCYDCVMEEFDTYDEAKKYLDRELNMYCIDNAEILEVVNRFVVK